MMICTFLISKLYCVIVVRVIIVESNEDAMELYPTINKIVLDKPITAYDKLDGSNIRAEWTRKNGFAKFGTRKRLLDSSDEMLGEAVGLFNDKYADVLAKVFHDNHWEKSTVFFEFYGANSFAGYHENEPHDVTLFDVHKYKQGFLIPRDFNELFSRVETAPILYVGKPNAEFVESVRNSTLEGMTFEGVVCKGELDNRRRPITFKVKADAWLEKLKTKCGDDEAMFTKLA